jgi:hypothetical protein
VWPSQLLLRHCALISSSISTAQFNCLDVINRVSLNEFGTIPGKTSGHADAGLWECYLSAMFASLPSGVVFECLLLFNDASVPCVLVPLGSRRARFQVVRGNAYDRTSWGPLSQGPNFKHCFLILMEVLDNLPHDRWVGR